MKANSIFVLALGLAVAMAPAGASAQKKHDNGRGNDRPVLVQQKAGPKFCQSGQGHPVHGRQWCRDHGFALGRSVVRVPTQRRYVHLSQPQLVALLSSSEWARLQRQAEERGYNGPYLGTSFYEEGLRVVTLRTGNVGIAEFVLDPNGRLLRSYFLR